MTGDSRRATSDARSYYRAVELEIDPEEIRMDRYKPYLFSTTSRTIHGPCLISDILASSESQYAVMRHVSTVLVRFGGSDGPVILRFGVPARCFHRWVATDFTQAIRVDAMESVSFEVVDDDPSATVIKFTTNYERPDGAGLYAEHRRYLLIERTSKQNKRWKKNAHGFLPPERLPE